MTSILLAGAHAAQLIQAAVQEKVDVALEEPSTAGYVWQASSDGAASIVDAGVTPGHAIGAASVHHFTVTATMPGRVTIRFALRRPWEASAPPAETASLTIEAR